MRCEAAAAVRCFEVCRTSELPAKGTFFVLFACTKRTKSTPEVCEPLDSGDDSKLCRKRFSIVFRRHVSKPVLPANRRRKGFESVRKGSCSADARLLFFEKGLLYCKLTAASAIQKGLLHVSLGAVGSWSFCALKKGLQNLVSPCKGFNCCGAKPPLRRAKSKFAKPRNFLRKGRFSCFLRRAKRTKKHARGLRASGLRGRFKALPKIFLIKFPSAHVETGFSHKTAAKRL